MDNRDNITYTEAATARKKKLLSKIDIEIEDELRARKFIPGEEIIEVTGSDVDELAQSMKVVFYKRFARTRQLNYLFLNFYAVLGIIITIAALFYQQLNTILFADPVRIAAVVMGVTFTLVSLFMRQYYNIRDSSEQELFREKPQPETTFYGGIAEGELVIGSAEWGTQDKKIVVTQNLNSLISRGRLSIEEVSNRVFGSDPAPGEFKELRIVYFYGGKVYSAKVPENGILNLP